MTVDWLIRHRIRLLLVALGIGALGYAFFGGSTLPIESYLLDGNTVVIRVEHAGGPTWTRVTDVRESDATVEITVRSVSAPVPMAGVLYALDLTVDLETPLGDRSVVDAFGRHAPRVNDVDASYLPCASASPTIRPSQLQSPGDDASAIIIVSSAADVQVGPADESLLHAFDQAWQFAELHPDDTGYPWLDPATGELVLSATSLAGRLLLEVEAIDLAVQYRIREVAHSFDDLQRMQHDITRLRDEGIPGAELIWGAFPDQRDNRIVVQISELSQELLGELARRFDGAALAVLVERAPRGGTGG